MEQLKWVVDWCRPRFKFKWWLITYLTVGAVVAGNFDNLGFNTNTISSRNTNGNIILDPNGTGQVRFNDLTASTFAYLDSNKDLTSQTATQATALLNAMVGDSGSGGTKGLAPAPAAGDAAALKYLKADGTWAVPSSTVAYRSMTSVGNILTTDHIVELSGASFTATLPTAVGVTGKIYELIHSDPSAIYYYTLATTSAQTIGGIASGSYRLMTTGERLKIASNGSNWIILDHYAMTGWTDYGVLSIGATTTAPTKGTVVNTDRRWWRRVGDSAEIHFDYFQAASAGSAAGSGDYLFMIPNNLAIDTAKVIENAGVGSPYTHTGIVGNCAITSAGSIYPGGSVFVYDSSQVRISATNSAITGMVGSATFPITGSNISYSCHFSVPISDWQP